MRPVMNTRRTRNHSNVIQMFDTPETGTTLRELWKNRSMETEFVNRRRAIGALVLALGSTGLTLGLSHANEDSYPNPSELSAMCSGEQTYIPKPGDGMADLKEIIDGVERYPLSTSPNYISNGYYKDALVSISFHEGVDSKIATMNDSTSKSFGVKYGEPLKLPTHCEANE